MSRKNKSAAIEDRRKQVAANLLGGLNYREMAEALNVSIGTIASDVKMIMGRWGREQVAEISEWAAIENRRFDRLLNAIWDRAVDGDNNAIDRAIKICESRRKLLGLDAPARQDITSGGEKIVQFVVTTDDGNN